MKFRFEWHRARRQDLSVIWVLERVGDVLWTREINEMRRVSFAEQLATIDRIFSQYRVARFAGDQTGIGKSGLPIRSGMTRVALFLLLVKSFNFRAWAAFNESFGFPIRIGKYGPNETEENKSVLMRALRNITGDGAAAIPASMSARRRRMSGCAKTLKLGMA